MVDETQAMGLLGHSHYPQAPFGLGGGRSLRWNELESPNVFYVSFLAKGFGVSIAVFSGRTKWLSGLERIAEHLSIAPPVYSTFACG